MPADRTAEERAREIDWPPRFTIAVKTPKEAAHLIRGLVEKSETGDIEALEPAFESIINIAIRTAEDAVRKEEQKACALVAQHVGAEYDEHAVGFAIAERIRERSREADDAE